MADSRDDLREGIAVILARAYHDGILTPDVYAMAGIVLSVRDDELDATLRRAEMAEAAVTRVHALHQPTEGMGDNCDEDNTPGSYGRIAQVCTSCGTSGEYGVRWPCPTLRALDVPADGEQTRRRNVHCSNCGDTRGGPFGHETSECTWSNHA